MDACILVRNFFPLFIRSPLALYLFFPIHSNPAYSSLFARISDDDFFVRLTHMLNSYPALPVEPFSLEERI